MNTKTGRWPRLALRAALAAGSLFSLQLAAAEFTTNATIGAGNTDYEAADIVVRAGTLTVEGSHAFGVVRLQGGTLQQNGTHLVMLDLDVEQGSYVLAGGATLSVSNVLRVATNAVFICRGANRSGLVNNAWAGLGGTLRLSQLVVERGGWLSADNEGYLGGDLGHGTGPGGGRRAWDLCSGGGHGGHGAVRGIDGGDIYGSVTEPNALGSGGAGGFSSRGGAGGGFIRVVADTVRVEGTISAHAEWGSGSIYGSGGAGGSIWLTTREFLGDGGVGARGGNPSGGNGVGGGGGRIAIHCETNGFRGVLVAAGGGVGGSRGGAGTIFVRSAAQPLGALWIDNRDPQFATPLTTLPAPVPLDQLTVSNGGQLSLWEGPFQAGDVTIGTEGRLYLQTELLGRNVWVDGGITHLAGSRGFHLRASGRVEVRSNAWISASGAGYGAGQGPGQGLYWGLDQASGAGYGGAGGLAARAPWGGPTPGGGVYGRADNPDELGSGGGTAASSSHAGGPGGGLLRLTVAGPVCIDGAISASGADGLGRGGGGSGGTICLTAARVTGPGTIAAGGGESC